MNYVVIVEKGEHCHRHRMRSLDLVHHLPKVADVANQGVGIPFGQVDREEVRPTRRIGPPVAHGFLASS
jgi:hypothetical protein